MWDVVKGAERLTPDEESPPAQMQISPQNWGLFPPDGGLGKGPGARMGGPRRVSWYSSSSLSGGVFSSTGCKALDRRSLEAVTSPLRGDGMLEPEGSVAAGLGGGAGLIPSPTHPQLPGDWGRRRPPH